MEAGGPALQLGVRAEGVGRGGRCGVHASRGTLMRILLAADPEIEVPPRLYGGIERIVDGLARRLQAQGHVVCLVAKAGSTSSVDVLHGWPGRHSQSQMDTIRNTWALWEAVR